MIEDQELKARRDKARQSIGNVKWLYLAIFILALLTLVMAYKYQTVAQDRDAAWKEWAIDSGCLAEDVNMSVFENMKYQRLLNVSLEEPRTNMIPAG